MTLCNIDEIISYVKNRGFLAERMFNDIEALQEKKDLRVVGLRLKGPRGNKTVISLENEIGDMDAVRLWCDGVDYSTSKVNKSRRSLS